MTLVKQHVNANVTGDGDVVNNGSWTSLHSICRNSAILKKAISNWNFNFDAWIEKKQQKP